MLFNSFEFVGFFCLFLLIYFQLPQRFRPACLLAASYLFYMSWEPVFVLLLMLTTLVDYLTARAMAASERPAIRRSAMIVALVINLGILASLKYGNFVAENIVALAGLAGIRMSWQHVSVILPVGVSFYTFQSIGYTLDVFFRRAPAERSLFYYAQYVAFFPQLVAGPIERVGHMMSQFKRPHDFKAENISPALWLIGWGLFKKMCIADQIAPFVDAVYARPGSFSGSYNLIATLLFGLQIYCDFSGYSSIARGVARLFDFDLMVNFRQPYFATSLSEFWGRWHISLSTWFRDYLYVPLGGNRLGGWRSYRNILIVFVVSGVWHGASWTFVIWGALHGLGLVLERLIGWPGNAARGTKQSPLSKAAAWMVTMAIVFVGWIFFRAYSLGDAMKVLASFNDWSPISYGVFKVAGFSSFEILLSALGLIVMFIVEAVIEHGRIPTVRGYLGRGGAMAASVMITYAIVLFGVFGRHEFIYFQF